MKIKLHLATFIGLFLAGCCPDGDDAPIVTEAKGWIPYEHGQMVTFRNNKQETFTLRAILKDGSYENTSGKKFCQYEVERRILKLTDPNSEAVSVQVTLQSGDIYIGKTDPDPNSDGVFNVDNNYQTIHGMNADRYKFLPTVTLNDKSYQTIIHYAEGASYDPGNVYNEYFLVKDQGLVAIKLKNNPDTFYVNY